MAELRDIAVITRGTKLAPSRAITLFAYSNAGHGGAGPPLPKGKGAPWMLTMFGDNEAGNLAAREVVSASLRNASQGMIRWALFRQPLSLAQTGFAALILIGAIGLNLTTIRPEA